MAGTARLGAISLDCADPVALGEFYKGMLGLEEMMTTPDFVALKGAGSVFLTFQRVVDHRAADWPEGPVPKQIHLELAVSDLDSEETRIVGLGATKAAVQPQPDNWRVLVDPAGHPFCITNLIPDA